MPVRQALEVPGRYGFHSTRSGHPARGVRLVMSDAHEGMKATVANVLKSSWPRCCFDFMRNALAHAARPDGASSPPSLPNRLPGTMPRLPRRSSARSPIGSATSCRSFRPFETAETDVLAYTTSRRSTGPSCTPPTRLSASTARSSGAPRWPASSPTRTPSFASSARSCSNKTKNGRSTVPVMTMEAVAPLRDDSSVSLTALAS